MSPPRGAQQHEESAAVHEFSTQTVAVCTDTFSREHLDAKGGGLAHGQGAVLADGAKAAAVQALAALWGGAEDWGLSELLVELGEKYADLIAENARLSGDFGHGHQDAGQPGGGAAAPDGAADDPQSPDQPKGTPANAQRFFRRKRPGGSVAGRTDSEGSMKNMVKISMDGTVDPQSPDQPEGTPLDDQRVSYRRKRPATSLAGMTDSEGSMKAMVNFSMDGMAVVDPMDTCPFSLSELDIGMCMEALDEHGRYTMTLPRLQEILLAFREHVATSSQEFAKVASSSSFIDCTSDIDFVNEVFGRRLARDVAHLRAALMHHMTSMILDSVSTDELDVATIQVSKLSKRVRKMLVLAREQTATFWVDAIGLALTVANAFCIAVSTLRDLRDEGWLGWDFTSIAFSAALFIEVATKLYLGGGFKAFMCQHADRFWNWFDVFILAACSLDLIALRGKNNMTQIVRLVRLVRLIRLGRYVTASVFRELSTILRGIEAGIRTLIWGSMLLFVVCAVQSVFFVTIMRHYAFEGEFAKYALWHFGTIPDAMLTLIRCHTFDCTTYDGNSLPDMAKGSFPWSVTPVFWFNTVFVSFGLCQIMFASFVEDARQARLYNSLELRARFEKERKWATRRAHVIISRILEIVPETRSVAEVRLTRRMWRFLIKDEKLVSCFEDMGYDAIERRRLYDRFDANGDGVIDGNELVSGLMAASLGKLDKDGATAAAVRSVLVKVAAIEKAVKAQQRVLSMSTMDSGDRRSASKLSRLPV